MKNWQNTWLLTLAIIQLFFAGTVLVGTLYPPHGLLLNGAVSGFSLLCAIISGYVFRHSKNRLLLTLLAIITCCLFMCLETLALYRIFIEHYPVFG